MVLGVSPGSSDVACRWNPGSDSHYVVDELCAADILMSSSSNFRNVERVFSKIK